MIHELRNLHVEDTITEDRVPFVVDDPYLFPKEDKEEEEYDPNLDPKGFRTIHVNRAERTLTQERYERIKPCFLYQSKEVVEATLNSTTQYYRNVLSGPHIYNTIKSPFPAHNVIRRHEAVATDTVFSDVAAVDSGGVKAAQIYIGRESRVMDCYPLKSTAEFINTLQDQIRKRGAMDKVISDSARVEISERVLELYRAYLIDDWQSEPYNLKLKGSGPLSYHLGAEFRRDPDGTLCMSAQWYVDRMIASFERMFGHKPKQYTSPMIPGDHPDLDTTDLLDEAGIQKYQSLIGQVQWAITLGRMDVHTAVMTMSGYRVAPRVGHLTRVQRIVGFLAKFRQAAIRLRTERPEYLSNIPDKEYDWEHTVYHGAEEQVPHDAPTPLGKVVDTVSFVDANLMHDTTTGRSVTGILHMLNKTLIDSFSKKQNTVETSTYGSEFVAARTATEQIMELRTTLRYMGIPLGKSYMFGDNKSVVDSSSIPEGKLTKRHMALSYHRVREAISAKVFRFVYIKGTRNPADLCSKHWGYNVAWPLLRPLMFWSGDTSNIVPSKDDKSSKRSVHEKGE